MSTRCSRRVTATEPGRQFYWAALAMQRLAVGLLLDAGDLPAAHTWLDAYERWLAWSGAVLGRSEAAALRARYHRSCGAMTPAREAAERAVLQARTPRQPLALLAALRLMGELDTATGRRAEAETQLRDALVLAEACHAPYEQALTRVALAELQAASSPATALATVAPARAIGVQLGAAPLLARIDALTATLTSPKRHTNPSGLTQRETQVLRLVAQGLTDAEVAARLFISPRTVGTHLTAIYTKLDVASPDGSGPQGGRAGHHLTPCVRVIPRRLRSSRR